MDERLGNGDGQIDKFEYTMLWFLRCGLIGQIILNSAYKTLRTWMRTVMAFSARVKCKQAHSFNSLTLTKTETDNV